MVNWGYEMLKSLTIKNVMPMPTIVPRNAEKKHKIAVNLFVFGEFE